MDALWERIARTEREIVNSLYEIEILKRSIAYVESDLLKIKRGEDSMEEKEKIEHVPFVAYEIQLERHAAEKKDLLVMHDAEKDKMRKHYRNIIIALCAVIATLIISIFGTVIYVLNNYEFTTYGQYVTAGDSGTATIADGIHNTTTE